MKKLIETTNSIIVVVLVGLLMLGPAAQTSQAATPVQVQLNPSLAEATQASIVALSIKLEDGTALQSNVNLVISNATALFASMATVNTTTGLSINEQIQNQILANQAEFLDNGLTSTQIATQQKYVATQGVNISVSEYTNVVVVPADERQGVINAVEAGLASTEAQFISGLKAILPTVPVTVGSHPITLLPAAYHFGPAKDLNNIHSHGRLVRVAEGIKTCAALAAIFALAACFCPALGIIAAIYAFEDAMGWC